ncbi:hypothetical protein AbraIFM66951_004025 [Aspergillus brasiliensis]|uniref:holo-[acyl-carrier-protein] synthase n=1 Tax=Aspergillus brasiliensis TaxID=319629 RepID=A0A9W5YWY5_9EURO|nr:hypothetical protein AbraCBS73388_010998 [Aspergillus brasiliensis]GKZ43296.1 hypothetical protein AbraIFM66951_004025 [Aspergillus brasiliensis]
MSTQSDPKPTLVRWYIDTRPLTATSSALPLLHTLQPSEQQAIQKFYHLKDRHMSLASNLLKYLFIHRTCRIPWSQITISRTPAPHHRPCFIPTATLLSSSNNSTPIPAVEFNVSHQDSLVALAGTTIPPNANKTTPPTEKLQVQVGIDITSTTEHLRSPRNPSPPTRSAFLEYVSIFTEIFSARELGLIKSLTHPVHHYPVSSTEGVVYSYRVFFAYWALKEAYIKMTGEALLAPWLRELEFLDVKVPDGDGEVYKGVRVEMKGREVRDVRVEVEAFQGGYLVATAARGGGIGRVDEGREDVWEGLRRMDIEGDVRDCAEGRCACLE